MIVWFEGYILIGEEILSISRITIHMFKNRILPVGLFFIFAVSSLLGADNWENETHFGVGVDQAIGEVAELFFEGQIKNQGMLRSPFFRKIEAGSEFELSDRISLRGSLKSLDLSGPGGWNRYYVPVGGGSLYWYPSSIEIDLRNLFEFWHLLGDGRTQVRLKQRIRVTFPVKLGKTRIEPYISEEYQTALNSNNHLIWNRVSGGNSFYFGKALRVDAFYIWQRRNGSLDWKDAHVLGCKLNFSL